MTPDSMKQAGLKDLLEILQRFAEKYPDSDEDTLKERAIAFQQAGGAYRGADGVLLINSKVADELAPRLGTIEITGNDDLAKCARADQYMRRRAPLPRSTGSTTAARERIQALPSLAPSASTDARLNRASEIIRVMEDAGYVEEDVDGY
jgi:hypothetical protein